MDSAGISFAMCGLRSGKIFYLRSSQSWCFGIPLKPSMITIAVTGGIGAGKTETVNILERLGAQTVNADLLGHATYAKGTKGHAEVIKSFGDKVIGEDGEIDRQALGSIVFTDPQGRQELEAIVWPRIREMLSETVARNADKEVEVTVIEAAVLYEAGWDDLADSVWTVESTYDQRLARVREKSGIDEHEAKRRIDAQISPETRIERADEVIHNDGDLTQLEQRVTSLWKKITKK